MKSSIRNPHMEKALDDSVFYKVFFHHWPKVEKTIFSSYLSPLQILWIRA